MPTNPLYLRFVADLRQYDQLTLVLFGVALLAVLIGWVMASPKTPHWQRSLYFCFLLLAFVLILAGTTWIVITGGTL